ncbi:uncharacterized protein VP01_5666g1, partial [Puccinia sorghi]
MLRSASFCLANAPISASLLCFILLKIISDVQLRTILTSKLEPSINANVITPDNEKSLKKIWKSISDYFASSQASNHTRIFNAVLHFQFNPNNVLESITQIKTAISRLHK